MHQKRAVPEGSSFRLCTGGHVFWTKTLPRATGALPFDVF